MIALPEDGHERDERSPPHAAASHADPQALSIQLEGVRQFPLIVIGQCPVARRVAAPWRGARQRPEG